MAPDESTVDFVADTDHAGDGYVVFAVARKWLPWRAGWVWCLGHASRPRRADAFADGAGDHVFAADTEGNDPAVAAHESLVAFTSIPLTGAAIETRARLAEQATSLVSWACETLAVSVIAKQRRSVRAAVGITRSALETAGIVAFALIDDEPALVVSGWIRVAAFAPTDT